MALYVIQSTGADGEPIYWNNRDGFGGLASATVFTVDEAQRYDLPIANDQPEWVELPVPTSAKQLQIMIRAWLDMEPATDWGDFEKQLAVLVEDD